jgi:hypothetical protein
MPEPQIEAQNAINNAVAKYLISSTLHSKEIDNLVFSLYEFSKDEIEFIQRFAF